MDRYHVVAGGYLRWLVCDRENDDEVVAVERSFELAQGAADDLNREFEDAGNIQLRYSHALATADLARAELLHPIDAWHASAEGHNVLAKAAFSDLAPSLQFLGLK